MRVRARWSAALRAALVCIAACVAAAEGAPRGSPHSSAARTASRVSSAAGAAVQRVDAFAAAVPADAPSLAWEAPAPAPAPGPAAEDVFAGLHRVDSGALAASAATCSVGVPFGSFAPTGGGGLNRVFLYDTAGGTRVFYLALPDGYDKPGAPARTLLLALHGGASYGDFFSAATSLNSKGTSAGYVVVAPNGLPGPGGIGGTWALNNEPGDGWGDLYSDVDETRFMRDIVLCVTALGVKLNGDAMLAGYSMGAKLACRLACSPPAGLRVRALALAGGIQDEASLSCAGGPVPLLLFQGGASDMQVPLCNRADHLGVFAYRPSWPQLAEGWVRYNGGSPTARSTRCSDLGDTAVYTFPGTGARTALVWLPTGGHVWPGLIAGCAGDATDVALAFYASAKAGATAAQPVPAGICSGLSTCAPPLPCDPPATEDWLSFR